MVAQDLAHKETLVLINGGRDGGMVNARNVLALAKFEF
jgi:hypothetical protein